MATISDFNKRMEFLGVTKEFIRQALIACGVECTEDETFRSYVDKIMFIGVNTGEMPMWLLKIQTIANEAKQYSLDSKAYKEACEAVLATMRDEVTGFQAQLDALKTRHEKGLVYKGTVERKSDLYLIPAEHVKTGDTYEVTQYGHNFMWDGSKWDDLGGTIDEQIIQEVRILSETSETLVPSEKAVRILANSIEAGESEQIAQLRADLNTEISNRISADTTIQTNISNEATTRASADTALQNNISSESTTRENADITLQSNITTEATARANADTALGGRIDSNSSRITSLESTTATHTQNIATNAANISALDTRLTTAESNISTLQTDLSTEVDTRSSEITRVENLVTAEVTARTNADITLQENLNIETGSRTSADTTLNNKITAEETARISKDAELQTSINNEATTRASADTTLQSNITTEATTRDTKDKEIVAMLKDEIDTRESADATLTTTLNKEISDRKADVKDLINLLKEETSERKAADTTLQTNITTEATARANADTTLQNNINSVSTNLSAEVTRATEAESTLTTNLASEVTARTNADITLQGNINSEATTRDTKDKEIVSMLKDEIDAREEAEGTLTTKLNKEISDRKTDVKDLSNLLKEETGERKAADTTLQTNITAEATRATGIEGGLRSDITTLQTDLTNHKNNTSNPHSVTKAQVGLGNVDNTSDANKPISTATQTALDTLTENLASEATVRANADTALQTNIDNEETRATGVESGLNTRLTTAETTLSSHTANTSNPHSVTKAQVGLGNVPNTDFTSDVSTLQTKVSTIENKIPNEATSTNQLADKEFVNSSVATNSAHYISNNGQPFTSVAQLEAYTGVVTNNDYAFVTGTDSVGNSYYDRYKATVSGSTITWAKEYRLNNSSFTAAQWAAISSGITALLVASYNEHLANTDIHVTTSDKSTWTAKYDKPTNGIPKTDLSDDVQTSLGLADSALQEHQSLAAYRTSSAQDEIDNAFVTKVEGKGLSTNDYDNVEKANVAANTNARHTHTNISELDLIASGDKAKWDAKYDKPTTGIPDTDLKEAHYTESEADAKFVTKVSGKGLSTEDYTTAEKTKLSGIESGADVNIIEKFSVKHSGSEDYVYITPDEEKCVKLDISNYVTTTDSRLSDARVASDVYAWAKAETKPSYTKSEVGLGNVTNNKQIKGNASGTTENHLVLWGNDGYTVKDGGAISTILPTPILGSNTAVTNPTEDVTNPYLNLVENGSISGQIQISGDNVGINATTKNGILTISSNGLVTSGNDTVIGYLISAAQYKSILDRLTALETAMAYDYYGYTGSSSNAD